MGDNQNHGCNDVSGRREDGSLDVLARSLGWSLYLCFCITGQRAIALPYLGLGTFLCMDDDGGPG